MLRIEKQLIGGLLPHQTVEFPIEDYEDPDTFEMKKRGTYVYVISKDNPHRNTTAGLISMVPVKHAGRLLFDVTHDLATADQIAAYHTEQKGRLEAQKADIVKTMKQQGKGADPDLISALERVAMAAVQAAGKEKRN